MKLYVNVYSALGLVSSTFRRSFSQCSRSRLRRSFGQGSGIVSSKLCKNIVILRPRSLRPKDLNVRYSHH